MSIRCYTPCDYDDICPYNAESDAECEYWCGSEGPEDYPENWDQEEYNYSTDDCDYEVGFDPYMGCFTDDC